MPRSCIQRGRNALDFSRKNDSQSLVEILEKAIVGQVSSRRCISDVCECMWLGWGDVAKPDWLLQAAFHRPSPSQTEPAAEASSAGSIAGLGGDGSEAMAVAVAVRSAGGLTATVAC